MEPLNDKRFIKYLIGYGITLMVCWTIFTMYLLPAFPESGAKGCIAIAGLLGLMILLGWLFVDVYEKTEK